ncbi:MAG: YggS family pyridoxal phosphate-dependent enzyme [Wenzhouxiangellaceae bacterium]
MHLSEPLATRVDQLSKRIAEACRNAGRGAESVTLLAVSKTRSAAEIGRVHSAGVDRFGENYTDEAADKQDALAQHALEWHFIGPIQSNKTRTIAERFDWVHSADRRKIITRLGRQRPNDRPPLNVLLQVNIDREPQKAGCEPEQIESLAADVEQFPSLRLRGLMAIPSADNSPARTKSAFAEMRSLFKSLQAGHSGVDTLSMGMSADLETAIAEGATMVRIGTALFGPRGDAG